MQFTWPAFKPWIIVLWYLGQRKPRLWSVGHDLYWSIFLGHFALFHTRSGVPFSYISVTNSTLLVLEHFSGIPHVCSLIFSNTTSTPPLSDSYTPDSLFPDTPATKTLTSIKRVEVFTSESSLALEPHSTHPTRDFKAYIDLGQLNIMAKNYSSSLSAQFAAALGSTILSWTSNQELQSYFCLTTVFLTPHIQSVTDRCHFFLANISWIHPLPFHSHSCGLSLGFGFDPLGICGLLASVPPYEHIKLQLNLTPLMNFAFSVCLF